jgi:D-alanyl-D-alanine carboxypeptidase
MRIRLKGPYPSARKLDTDSQNLYLSGPAYTKTDAERKVEELSLAREMIRTLSLRAAAAALVGLLIVAVAAPAQAQAQGRYASIVIDADTGAILHASNPDKRSYPASLTKVMTLFLLFDALEQGKLKLTSQMPVSGHASAQAPSKLNLEPGDRISVEEAIEALVTKSANDVAVVIAEAVGGTEASFAQMMTRKARALGMTQTTYRNASGLPDLGQVSTVRDQATLARALIRTYPDYYRYFSTRSFNWNGTVIPSHNRLMLRYAGADGLKTGYIHASGFNLIASARRDGHRIIGVVFGGNTASWRDNHMANLLDKGFARVRSGGEMRVAKAEPQLPDVDELKVAAAAAKGKAIKAKAKAKAIVPDEEDEAAGDADPSPWTIQVGAFSTYQPAHKAATDAVKRLGGLVSKSSIDIDKGKQGKQVMYRARVTGFTEEQARSACRKLERAKKSCKVIQPS